MWSVSAQIVINTKDGYRQSFGIPTFYLDENVQGIIDAEHAEKIAKEIINPAKLDNMEIYLNCVKVE